MIDLNGRWKLTCVEHGTDIAPFLAEDFVPEGWLDARVPEDVRATLRRAGAIRGNTYEKREDEERWIEEADWVYHRRFFLGDAAGRLRLVFEGLDCFCSVYLNGHAAGQSDNMFVPCVIDAGPLLRRGLNTLVVHVRSATAEVAGRDDSMLFSITGSDRLFARKAQMSYGWDFCGRCVTAGIWKAVRLEDVPEHEMPDLYAWTAALQGDTAVLRVEAEVPRDCRLRAALSFDGKTAACAELLPGEDGAVCAADLAVRRARLWWPRPYGPQPLYDLTMELLHGDEVAARRTVRVGLRTLEVLREPQPDGTSFQFCVNGRKLFIRGANWVPLNTLFSGIGASDYETLIRRAVEGRLSMLRVWGGGIYENDAFFDACDREGILVWQDFMLACGIYPRDDAFLAGLAREAEHVVRRYRNRACLALWSADNENGQAYIWARRTYEFERDPINHRVLKEVCARLDPHRFYLHTSPGSPDPAARGGGDQESPYQGDVHLYYLSSHPGVNAARDYGREYYRRVLGIRPRFVSEFGFISLLGRDSYGRFNPRRLPLRNPGEPVRYMPLLKDYLDRGDTDAAIRYSQTIQAMALSWYIEYFRSLKGTCSGTLYWKFNDPLADCPDAYAYPSQMSAVDMYHKPRMSWYAARRSYADVLLALVDRLEGGTGAVLVNETEAPLAGRLVIERRRFTGEVLVRREMPCSCPADTAEVQYELDGELLTPRDPYGEYILARVDGLASAGSTALTARRFFADLHQIDRLRLPGGELEAVIRRVPGGWTLALSARSYIRCLRLEIPDVPASYTDNYFDLDPGTVFDCVILPWDAPDLSEAVISLEAENLPRITVPVCEIPENGERRLSAGAPVT